MLLKRAVACTGNADSTFWQAVKVFNDCNVPFAQTVIPRVKRGAKCLLFFCFFTSNKSRSEMSKPNS